MPRRGTVDKREILPDPVYNSRLVTKFINNVTKDGKKTVAERIFYGALGVIEERMQNGQTGSAWQRGWVARHGRDLPAMTAAYLERQDSGRPVHEWGLDPA